MIDDIPEAIRESIDTNSSPQLPIAVFAMGGFLLGTVAIAIFAFSSRSSVQPNQTVSNSAVSTQSTTTVESQTEPDIPESKAPKIEPVDNILGHLPYEETSPSQLSPITNDGKISLKKVAATKFKQMQAAARNEGIILTPISGFRSIESQNHLFFDVKEQRVQDASKRAEVSAPPGYSEHHTGYAVDVGDGNVPATNLNQNFEDTAAFRWLEQNAARYSFELSFPPDNPQGISYEPWHWRFVGDRESLETFYKARNLNNK